MYESLFTLAIVHLITSMLLGSFLSVLCLGFTSSIVPSDNPFSCLFSYTRSTVGLQLQGPEGGGHHDPVARRGPEVKHGLARDLVPHLAVDHALPLSRNPGHAHALERSQSHVPVHSQEFDENQVPVRHHLRDENVGRLRQLRKILQMWLGLSAHGRNWDSRERRVSSVLDDLGAGLFSVVERVGLGGWLPMRVLRTTDETMRVPIDVCSKNNTDFDGDEDWGLPPGSADAQDQVRATLARV
jgi:hypothetical protein